MLVEKGEGPAAGDPGPIPGCWGLRQRGPGHLFAAIEKRAKAGFIKLKNTTAVSRENGWDEMRGL